MKMRLANETLCEWNVTDEHAGIIRAEQAMHFLEIRAKQLPVKSSSKVVELEASTQDAQESKDLVFSDMNLQERYDRVRELKLCENCFSPYHNKTNSASWKP